MKKIRKMSKDPFFKDPSKDFSVSKQLKILRNNNQIKSVFCRPKIDQRPRKA